MRNIGVALIGSGLLIAAGTAQAADPNGQTPCSEVRAIFDAEPPNLATVKSAVLSIEAVLESLDAQRAKAGRPRVFSKLNAEGRETTVAIVTASCGEHPADALTERAAEVLDTAGAIRALGQ